MGKPASLFPPSIPFGVLLESMCSFGMVYMRVRVRVRVCVCVCVCVCVYRSVSCVGLCPIQLACHLWMHIPL